MSRPKTILDPTKAPKSKNYPKIKSTAKVRIEGTIENKIHFTIHE